MTSEEIFKTMQDLIAEQFAVNADDVTMNSSFEDDLIAAHLTESILNRYEDLSAIYITCHGEKGVCDTLRKHKKMKKVTIIACDLSRQNYRYLKNGDIKYLIGQDGRYQGYEARRYRNSHCFENRQPRP